MIFGILLSCSCLSVARNSWDNGNTHGGSLKDLGLDGSSTHFCANQKKLKLFKYFTRRRIMIYVSNMMFQTTNYSQGRCL